MSSQSFALTATESGQAACTPFFIGRFNICMRSRITELDTLAWNESGAVRHPLKDVPFLHALELAYPKRGRRYVEVQVGEQLVAQFILNQDFVDPVMFAAEGVKAVVGTIRRLLPRFLRLRLVTVGTMDTLGAHWWYDPAKISVGELSEILVTAASHAFPQAHLLVVRDFMDGDPIAEALAQTLASHAFSRVESLPISTIRTTSDASTYYTKLRRTVRQFIRKMPQLASERGVRFEVTTSFEEYLDECYRLFMNVSRRSKELQRDEPVPIQLFREFARLSGSRMTIAWGPEGRIVGFVLTRVVGRIACPAYVGLDYEFNPAVRLYHQLLWSEIQTCLNQGVAEIDLGVTSYFVKQGYGAELNSCTMMVRCQNLFINRLLKPIIPSLLRVEQPQERRQES